MKSKTWCILAAALCVALLGALAAVTAAVDPYFHYHAPAEGLSYELHSERYQNDGIVRHFTYDAILSGTSLCENFKASEFDALFGVRSVKVPFSGGSFRELRENLRRALDENGDVKVVLRSLDYDYLIREADYYRYTGYPAYLYDDLLLNDVSYVLNKTVFTEETASVLERTRLGLPMTDFDEYASWTVSQGTTPMEYRSSRAGTLGLTLDDGEPLSEEQRRMVTENVTENVLSLAEAYPDTEFYLFFPPCSIYYWDRELQWGDLAKDLEAIRMAAELLLPCGNVHLFSYIDREDVIFDLEDYSELEHYSAATNSKLLQWMRDGENELTQENFEAYMQSLTAFFRGTDFDALFAP